MNAIRRLPRMLAISALMFLGRCSCGPDFGGMVVPDAGVINTYDCLCVCGIPSTPAGNESQIVTACLTAPIAVDMIDFNVLKTDSPLETADDGDGVCEAPGTASMVPPTESPPPGVAAPQGRRGCSATGELAASALALLLFSRRRTRSTAAAVLLLIGCRGPSTPTDSQVAACLSDLWVSPTHSACTCVGSVSPPECAATDCDSRSYLYFDLSELAEGYLTVSRERATFSTAAPPISNAAHVQAGELVFDSGRPARRITCGDTSLTLGSELFSRADARLSRSFKAQWSQNSSREWRGAALEPN